MTMVYTFRKGINTEAEGELFRGSKQFNHEQWDETEQRKK